MAGGRHVTAPAASRPQSALTVVFPGLSSGSVTYMGFSILNRQHGARIERGGHGRNPERDQPRPGDPRVPAVIGTSPFSGAAREGPRSPHHGQDPGSGWGWGDAGGCWGLLGAAGGCWEEGCQGCT
uniref:Uncharacterized protein n=1 Tax=Knipowitschia caucasica TaxID=637954 RepID=A0AAV2MA61_KNICA